MHPIDLLMEEHRTAEAVLDSLCLFARTTLEEVVDGRGSLSQFVELLRMFDELHHKKEEDMLFDQMTSNGFPRDGGPVAVMLSEHAECRGLVARLAELADRPEPWTDRDRRDLEGTATEYTLFLKAHIAKEDNVLYPMSRRVLAEPEWQQLEAAFTEFEHEWKRDGRLDAFRDRVAQLREAWPAEDGPTPSTGCGL